MSDKVEPEKGEGKEGEDSTASTRSATMLDVYWLAAALPKYCLPAIWLIVYALVVPLLTVGGRPFWTMCMVLAVTTTLLLIMYSLEAIPYGNLYRHADGFTSGMMFLKHFAYSTWFFNGIDTITVTCTDAKEPNKAIPKAMVGTILSAYGMAIFLMLASASLPPSTWNLVHEEHPLSSGYEFVLGLTRPNSQKKKKKAKASIFSVRYWIILIFHKGIQPSGSANPRAANLPKVGHASTAASASLAGAGNIGGIKADNVAESSQPDVVQKSSLSGRLVHNHMVAVYPGIVEADKAEEDDHSVDTNREDDSAEVRPAVQTSSSHRIS
eukprot:gene3785-4135_t